MIIIEFSPTRTDVALSLEVVGEVVKVNGEDFDFSQIPEGGTLPAEAIDSPWFVGPVERVNGHIKLTVTLPHGPNPSDAVAFPQPVEVTEDGPVTLPADLREPEPESPMELEA